MELVYLNDMNLSEEDLRRLGGKAANLNRLSQAGFPVPPGFILYEEHSGKIVEGIKNIGGFPVAVRSSGSLEDLADASFAGLYETFLSIHDSDQLDLAIKKCFQSKDSDRVKDYLQTKKINFSTSSLTMSVLVQKMVDVQIAGVLFTLNPITGKEEEIYIELCEGVGERLVSGHVTPSQIVYDWFSHKKISETINLEGTKISDEHLKELVDLAVRIQAYYGAPQDIEWAIGMDGKVYILQSRPITTFNLRTDKPELTNADLKDGGVSARVCTPFMYSAYRDALKYSMGDYFKRINLLSSDEHVEWIHYNYGRVYWNAEAVKEGLKKIPNYKEEDFDRDLGVQKDYGPHGPYRTPVSIATIINAIPVLVGLQREYLDCLNLIRQFRVRFELKDEELKLSLHRLHKMDEREFYSWFMDVILFQNETEKNYFRTIYNNSNFQTEYKGYLKKLKGYEEGDEVELMSELHGVAHLDVQAGLGKLRKIADFYGFDSRTYYSAREDFLKVHYHHGPAELDLTVPRWGEKKEWVDELVENYNFTPSLDQGKFENTYRKLSERLPFYKRSKFFRLTEESRNFLRVREEMRSYSTRAYYLLRLGTLEFARRNNLSEEDVFMLDLLEIRKKLVHPSFNLPDTTKRKLYYQGYRHFKAPNEFGGTILAVKSSVKEGSLKGLGCSPGTITGRAKVILDIHQTGNLTKEDILVTAFTDPGWTPVLARVGGVVTEVGGLLSHAAVIGREYGIPAVLNLIDATRIIKDGDLIRIDGKSGIVEILEKSSEG